MNRDKTQPKFKTGDEAYLWRMIYETVLDEMTAGNWVDVKAYGLAGRVADRVLGRVRESP